MLSALTLFARTPSHADFADSLWQSLEILNGPQLPLLRSSAARSILLTLLAALGFVEEAQGPFLLLHCSVALCFVSYPSCEPLAQLILSTRPDGR